MIYSDEHKYIFFRIPNTGGAVIEERLISKWKGKKAAEYMSATEARLFLGNDRFNLYMKFSTVRNPYDLTLAWFEYLKHKATKKNNKLLNPGDNFYDFVMNQQQIAKDKKLQVFRLWQTQRNYLAIHDDCQIKYAIKYEKLQEGYDYVCKRLFNQLDMMPLPKVNIRDYRKRYNHEMIERLEEIYREDLEFFRYVY